MPLLLYVSPQFPSLSLVFEQNEILGLLHAGADVRVVTCRPARRSSRRQLHVFARPILDITTQPRAEDVVMGLLGCVCTRPAAFFRNVCSVLVSLRSPRSVFKVAGAFMLAAGFCWRFRLQRVACVHADFGQHSATLALFLARLLGVAFTFKVHAVDIFVQDLAARDPLREEKAIEAARVFSAHEYGRTCLERDLPAIIGKIVVSYVSVRTNDLAFMPPSENSRRFVFLGRLVRKKGLLVLVDAMAALQEQGCDCTADIYGVGEEGPRLRQYIARKGLGHRISLCGSYDNDSLPSILRDAIAVVVPSIPTRSGDMDGVPTVIYESMALGRPVISTELSGIPEVVRDGETGLLVPPGDVEMLAKAMRVLIEDRPLAQRLAIAARRRVESGHDNVSVASAMLEELRAACPGLVGKGLP